MVCRRVVKLAAMAVQGVLTLVAVLAFGMPMALASCHDDSFIDQTGCTPAVVGGDKYVYSYDPDAGVLRRARPRAGEQVSKEGSRALWEYAYTPACMVNGPPDENGVFPGGEDMCLQADAVGACPPDEFGMYGYRRLLRDEQGADVEAPVWERIPGIHCFGAEQEWTRAELTQIAQNLIGEYLEEHAAAARVALEPPGGTLVNLPVVAHTEELPDIGFTVTQPFPGRLDAAASYTWDFGEGAHQDGPGRPYTPEVSPLADPGYYVAYPYTTAGTKKITLTTTWGATFTVAGIEIPLDSITFDTSAQVEVFTARSELVAADR